MRTKLVASEARNLSGTWHVWINDENGKLVTYPHLAFDASKEDTEDFFNHLVACWNAVEAIGGDPDRAGELVKALEMAQGDLQRLVLYHDETPSDSVLTEINAALTNETKE